MLSGPVSSDFHNTAPPFHSDPSLSHSIVIPRIVLTSMPYYCLLVGLAVSAHLCPLECKLLVHRILSICFLLYLSIWNRAGT